MFDMGLRHEIDRSKECGGGAHTSKVCALPFLSLAAPWYRVPPPPLPGTFRPSGTKNNNKTR